MDERKTARRRNTVLNELEQFVLTKDALELLTEYERNIIHLKYWFEFSNIEIAKILKVPPTTIQGRCRLIMDKLRRILVDKELDNEESRSTAIQ